MRQLFPRTLLIAAAAGLTACGGDTPTVNKNPAITLTVSGQAVTVAQGASQTLVAAIVRTDFDGAVSLTASGAPTGVQVSFAPASLASGVNASTITFIAGASATTGTHNVTITAAGDGITSRTATVALTITATGGYSLSLTPATIALAQGANTTTTVNVNRTGSFTGAVALTVTGLPTGMMAGFTPSSATGATSVLSLSAGAATPVGSYPVTVRGNAAGMPEQTVALTVNVTAASAGTQITLTFCDADLPVWVGYQNDGGAWTQATVTGTGGGNVATFTLTSARAGVAFVHSDPAVGTDTDVTYATTSEIAALAQASTTYCTSGGTIGTKSLTGSVSGLTAANLAEVYLAGSYANVPGTGPGFTYSLTEVPDGPRDLIATRSDLALGFVTDKLIVRRALNLATGSAIPVLDFNAAEAVAPASATLTVTGLAATDEGAVFTSFSTANGSTAFLGFGDLTASTTYTGVPSSRVIAGDMHQIAAYVENAASTSGRSVLAYHQQVAARTLAMGAELTAPTLSTVSATTPLRVRALLPLQNEYAGSANASFYQEGSQNGVYVTMTAAYRGTATNWDLAVPDFGSAAGYSAAWGLQAGGAYGWDVTATSSGLHHFNTPTEGTIIKMASRYSAAPVSPMVQGSARPELPKQLAPRRWLAPRQ